MIRKLIRFAGLTNIMCAVLLFLSWCSIGIFMWEEIRDQDFTALVQNSAWIPVNIIFLIATILLLPSIIGLYLQQAEKIGKGGLIAFLLALLGVAWYACIQFYETFFWPLIASEAPNLFQAVGFSPSNKLIYTQFILSGVPWVIGFLLLGIFSFRSRFFPSWAAILFTIGSVLFGVGMVMPIRTIGVILFCIGMFRLGIVLLKNEAT